MMNTINMKNNVKPRIKYIIKYILLFQHYKILQVVLNIIDKYSIYKIKNGYLIHTF